MRGEGKKLAEAARLWARGELDESPQSEHEAEAEQLDHLQEQMHALGIVPEEPLQPCVTGGTRFFYLWPENERAWRFFKAVCTQWRHGFNGATGLDYGAVRTVMESPGPWRVPFRRRREMWHFLSFMEQGALQGWHERRDEQ